MECARFFVTWHMEHLHRFALLALVAIAVCLWLVVMPAPQTISALNSPMDGWPPPWRICLGQPVPCDQQMMICDDPWDEYGRGPNSIWIKKTDWPNYQQFFPSDYAMDGYMRAYCPSHSVVMILVKRGAK